MDKRLVLIYLDDWEGVYVDGKLYGEDHSLDDTKFWIELVSKFRLSLDDYRSQYIGDKVDEDFNSLPETLDELYKIV